jgi:uncharacterized membrane protein YgdD (TMEM256/DUF423 family)
MSSTGKLFGSLAAISLLIATLLGAVASHGLQHLEQRALQTVQTAVDYQFYHGLALLAVALIGERIIGRAIQLAGLLFVAGMVLFCGGIYASVLLEIGFLSRVTPLGGSAFIAGWATLAYAILRASPR